MGVSTGLCGWLRTTVTVQRWVVKRWVVKRWPAGCAKLLAMTKHLEAPFTMDRWAPLPTSAVTTEAAGGDTAGGDTAGGAGAGGPEAGVVELAKTYTGPELVGRSTGHALTTRGDRGASYVAQERFVGSLNGLHGTFVLEHRASMGEGFPTVMDAAVVHGSGTGDLAVLAGVGLVEHGMLILDYELGTS